MTIAFDFQGTLDVHPELQFIAKKLQEAGVEVVIISAMPVTMPGVREREIENANLGIPYRVVYHELENYHQSAALKKVELMRELGAPIIFDDTLPVVETVRQNGLKALHI